MLFLILAVLVLLFLWTITKDLFQTYWHNAPPGPISLPVVGGAWAVNPTHLPKSLLSLSRRYGPVFSVRLGTQGRVVFVNSPSAANSLLMDKMAGHRPILPVLDYLSRGRYGLMVSPQGPLWQAHTRLCHKAFSKHLSSEKTIGQCLQPLWTRFNALCGQPFNPKTDTHQVSFNFLWEVLFDGGSDRSQPCTQTTKLMRHHDVVMETLSPTSPLHAIPWLLRFPNKWSRPLMESVQARDKMLLAEYERCIGIKQNKDDKKHVTKKRAESLVSCGKTHEENTKCGRAKPAVKSTMEIFVEQMTPDSHLSGERQIPPKDNPGDMFSYNHVTQTIWGLLLAGVDTTSSALEWIVLLLGAFPSSADSLRNEMSQVLGEREPTLRDKIYLPYTEAWLRECLRFSSVVGLCPPHVSDRDLILQGYTVPKGTPIVVNIWAIHHNPKVWQDPESFRPERFLDDSGSIRPTWDMPEYLPFSRGTRPCVGAMLSRSFLFMFLVRFSQKFKVTLMCSPDLESVTKFGQAPKPYTIILTKP